ncbi:YhgE/Pip domain-containing protein [Clostridium estertheticum]|uniref:YhgE/Pip domain-containing protein n=1 Tax=Clostridium estertheticum TaxID=238834 RepID=UPI001C6DEDE0|nr:YhgE/Pip domain-containing protein [Clostridium estertheticum]MBW9151306.1 YhgE/Pip domain-containing protein [Clostridium estertheticum]WLC84718.1 YhgE/Pip domain-containing protein [Clostridium estertheticum]
MKKIFKGPRINMKKVLKIYRRDIKSILCSYVTLIIVVGISCLPALYAWFNIQAGWDPYSKTKGLLVAVVNLDTGSKLKDTKVNIGNDLVKKLKTNESIGWTFVNENEAKEGVKYGKYYASFVIPKDFSKDFLSITSYTDPIKAKLIYTVNEKENAVAPKITGSGATSLQEQITQTFIETASETLFTYLNQVGVDLAKDKPKLESLIDMVISADDNMPKIGSSLDNVYTEALMFQKLMKNVRGDIPTISGAIDNTLDLTKTSDKYAQKGKNSLQTVSPLMKADLALIKNKADDAESSLTDFQDSKSSNNTALIKARDKYTDGIQKIDNVLALNKSINNSLNSNVIGNFINRLTSVKNEMTKQKADVNSMIDTVDHGNTVLTSNITAAVQGANKASGLINNTMNLFDRETSDAIDDAMNNASGLSNGATSILQNMQGNMPLITSMLDQTNTQFDAGVGSLKEIKDKFPGLQKDIHSNAQKLKKLTDDEKINELVKILKRDGKKESDFLANPIELVQNRVYPIPNYGSAMTPFYTILAIWVGAFILVSILSVHIKDFKDGTLLTTKEKFLGRYFTFVSIGILQTLITIAGNLFILKTYAVSPIILTLFGVYVSIVFTTIIYTFVSVLGNGGKALTMIALVLQVSGSGGTFPIELLGNFFQYINPMMPFTYAIGGMREATAGIIPDVLIKNMLILAIYFIIFLLLGLFLKEKINKKTAGFVKQFHQSGLTGE